MPNLEDLPTSPDDWVLTKIAEEFLSYEDAKKYFTNNCNCMIEFVCVAEEIGRFITDADGSAHLGGKKRLQEIFQRFGKPWKEK